MNSSPTDQPTDQPSSLLGTPGLARETRENPMELMGSAGSPSYKAPGLGKISDVLLIVALDRHGCRPFPHTYAHYSLPPSLPPAFGTSCRIKFVRAKHLWSTDIWSFGCLLVEVRCLITKTQSWS